jgi:hypothetical protein
MRFVLPSTAVSSETPFMPDEAAPDPELQIFDFANGTIIGHDDAVEAEHFAADFQGLRHFANKIADTMDLGEVWMGGFREKDFTLMWSCAIDGLSGQGAMIDSSAPLFELLQHVSPDV